MALAIVNDVDHGKNRNYKDDRTRNTSFYNTKQQINSIRMGSRTSGMRPFSKLLFLDVNSTAARGQQRTGMPEEQYLTSLVGHKKKGYSISRTI